MKLGRRYGKWLGVMTVALVAGFGLAAFSVARSFTLHVASHAKVTNMMSHVTKTENVVVDSRNFAVYTLSGDSAQHQECRKANACFGFWPPVTVASANHLSAAPGVKGRLGTFKRNGFTQLTLNGHPLYQFFIDKANHGAVGEGVVSFGGTWHAVLSSSQSKTTQSTPKTTPTPAPTPYTPPGY